MGILNVTPDSFSDGGEWFDVERAVARGVEMAEQGACIIDVGGESTRPGSQPVGAEEEIRRTVPVIALLRKVLPDVFISIDTWRTSTARAALDAGADIVNDISGLRDAGMAELTAESGAGVVIMHMAGTPELMQMKPEYDDVVAEVNSFFEARAAFAESCGVRREQICFDPGIGFGKTDEHNVELLRARPVFAASGRPLLAGVSRKSMFGRLLGRENPRDRLAASLAAGVFAALNGAQILRVHDVLESCDAMRVVDRLRT